MFASICYLNAFLLHQEFQGKAKIGSVLGSLSLTVLATNFNRLVS